MNDEHDISDTVAEIKNGDVKEALHDDLEATKDDVKEGAEWVKDKAQDAGNAAENAAERVGINKGDPNSNND